MSAWLVWDFMADAFARVSLLLVAIIVLQDDFMQRALAALHFAPILFSCNVVLIVLHILLGEPGAAIVELLVASFIWSNMRHGGYW